MFALFLVILLWPSRNAAGGSAEPQWTYCHETLTDYCLQLSHSDITAEAGLCAVIECSFKTASGFNPSGLIWLKCGDEKCDEVIFDSKNTIQSSFSGRVSLLESDLSRRKCSIIINDLRLSDSGKYVFRVHGVLNGRDDRFVFDHKATISVTALQQKPTVLSPALTEGQRASLSCIAPGLCSGSEPTFTWTWRGAGEVPNITTATTDHLTPVSHRHSSTLKLTASAELHGAELSCTVSYKSSSTQDSVRINVTYVKNIGVSGDTVVKEGDSLNVTCSVDSFPPSRIMWFGPNKTRLKMSGATERSSQTDLGSSSLLIHNMSQAQSGQYTCEGLHLNSSQTRHINISVKYVRKPVLFGDTRVEEGSVLNLTCSVDSFPPSSVTIRKRGAEVTKQTETHKYKSDPGSAGLVIMNVNKEDAGVYECTAQHELNNQTTQVDVKVLYMRNPVIFGNTSVNEGGVLNLTCSVDSVPPSIVSLRKAGTVQNETTRNQQDPGTDTLVISNMTQINVGRYVCTGQSGGKTLATSVDVKLQWKPHILSSSGCVYDQDVLSCTCVSRATPLPTVTWPLLLNYSEYSLVTTVTGTTVNSTLVLRASERDRTGVKCVSENRAGLAQQTLTPSVPDTAQRRDSSQNISILSLEVILAFILGLLLSAALCCLIMTFSRRKQKDHPSSGNQTEMRNGNVSEEAYAEPREAHYASIDFAAMAGRGSRNRPNVEETTETEYAEVKKKVKREEPRAEEGAAMMEEKATQNEPDEEGDSALYSNVQKRVAKE